MIHPSARRIKNRVEKAGFTWKSVEDSGAPLISPHPPTVACFGHFTLGQLQCMHACKSMLVYHPTTRNHMQSSLRPFAGQDLSGPLLACVPSSELLPGRTLAHYPLYLQPLSLLHDPDPASFRSNRSMKTKSLPASDLLMLAFWALKSGGDG